MLVTTMAAVGTITEIGMLFGLDETCGYRWRRNCRTVGQTTSDGHFVSAASNQLLARAKTNSHFQPKRSGWV